MAHASPFFSLVWPLPLELLPTGEFIISSRLILHLATFATTLTTFVLFIDMIHIFHQSRLQCTLVLSILLIRTRVAALARRVGSIEVRHVLPLSRPAAINFLF